MVNEISVGNISVSCFQSIEDVIKHVILNNDKVKPGVAIAINPEKIILSKNNDEMKEVITKATLRYPDGMGVSYVMSKKLGKKVARIPGCELWEQLLLASGKYNVPVFIVGASEAVVLLTYQKLIEQGVNVVGYQNGYFDSSTREKVIHRIKESGAKIVSVALGSPKQEYFMFECRKIVPDAFFMGVGGTYDVFTGNVKRAPSLFIKCKCEWLYRLLSQPTRVGRQLNLLKYIMLYLRGKL